MDSLSWTGACLSAIRATARYLACIALPVFEVLAWCTTLVGTADDIIKSITPRYVKIFHIDVGTRGKHKRNYSSDNYSRVQCSTCVQCKIFLGTVLKHVLDFIRTVGWFVLWRSVGAMGRPVVWSSINASYSCAFQQAKDGIFFQAGT